MDIAMSKKLYWSICMSGMLYGIELMSLSSSQVEILETGHRQMGKQIQGLPVSTPNPAVYPQIGWISIRGYILRKMMLFLCKTLCNPVSNVYKDVVIDRITHLRYMCESSNSPVANMYQACKQLGIAAAIHDGLDSGVMPSYTSFKRWINKAVLDAEDAMNQVSLHMYDCLDVFRMVVHGIKLCSWWQLAEKHSHLRNQCRSAVLLITWFDSRYRKVRCDLCNT